MENGVEATDSTGYSSNEDLEVKKLKDLVRKLEKQNEHLRHRTGKLTNSSKRKSNVEVEDASGDNVLPDKEGDITTLNDGIALLDEDDLLVNTNYGDDTSWLYQSPVVKSKAKRSESYSNKTWRSPQEWLTDELEHPTTPQLVSAKQNILRKLDGVYDYNIPSRLSDISYLQRSVEKDLNLTDTYKLEDATDVQVVARMQQEELRKDTVTSTRNSNDRQENTSYTHQTSPRTQHTMELDVPINQERKGSLEEELDHHSSSSGSPHHGHHLPVPSQTMTTAYGLYPSTMCKEDESPARRPSTPTRLERHSPSPRSISPAPARKPNTGVKGLRRSLPHPSRTHTPSKSNSNLASNSYTQDYSTPPSHSAPNIKSSLIAPTSRLTKLTTRTGIPQSPSASSPMGNGARASPARRTLPRPSQTSTSMRYPSTTSNRPTPAAAPEPQPSADIWDDDDEVY
ncbi:uncharacterized protein LOC100185312 [Ciona intestinalis]